MFSNQARDCNQHYWPKLKLCLWKKSRHVPKELSNHLLFLHHIWKKMVKYVKPSSKQKTRFKMNPKPLDKCFFGLEQVQTSLYKFKKVNWFIASFKMLIIFTSFNHVWTFLKDSAIKHNYCITFSKQDWTCLLYDAT